jgi:hypothetical protein
MNLAQLRQDRTLAYVVPLVVFMVVGAGLGILTGSMESVFRDHEFLPWWRRYPDQWIYPLQTLIAGLVILFWWRHYELKWTTWKVLAGAALGAIGIGLWILPTQTYEWWGLTGETEGWRKALGILPRREGFDPGVFESSGARCPAVFAGGDCGVAGGGTALAGIPDAFYSETGRGLLESAFWHVLVEKLSRGHAACGLHS